MTNASTPRWVSRLKSMWGRGTEDVTPDPTGEGRDPVLWRLNKDVQLHRAALASAWADAANRHDHVLALAAALRRRHVYAGQLEDLNDSIELLRPVLTTMREDHPARSLILCELGLSVADLAGHDGVEHAGLDATITLVEEAGSATVSTSRNSIPLIDSNSALLLSRYALQRDIADLARAHTLAQEALKGGDTLDRARASRHLRMAAALRYTHSRTGYLAPLDQAVVHLDAALAAVGTAAHNRPRALMARGDSLSDRFRHTADPADITAAVQDFREALKLTVPNHPRRPTRALALGDTLFARYERARDPRDLREAATCYRQAIDHGLPGNPVGEQLHSIARAHQILYSTDGEAADLDTAISLYRTVLQTGDREDSSRSTWTHNLGSALHARFQRDGDPADLDSAITLYLDAVKSADAKHVSRSRRCTDAASGFWARYYRIRDPEDAVRTVQWLLEAMRSSKAAIPDYVRAGQWLQTFLRHLEQEQQISKEMTQSLSLGLGAGPDGVQVGVRSWCARIVDTVFDHVDDLKYTISSDAWVAALGYLQGMTASACQQAASDGDLQLALQLVERGCAVTASARKQQQDAILTRLREDGHTALVDAYQQSLDCYVTALRDGDRDASETHANAIHDLRSRLEFAWGGPLAPQATSAELARDVASGNPLTYLLATPSGGLALTIDAGQGQSDLTISAVELPDLYTSAVENLMTTEHAFANSTRGIAWRKSWATPEPPRNAGLVVEELIWRMQPLESPTHRLTNQAGVARIVPVGLLAQLPLTPALAALLTPADGDRTIGVTMAASAKLHLLAGSATKSAPSSPAPGIDPDTQIKADTATEPMRQVLVAVTNPRPCTWAGRTQSDLPAATKEGRYLQQRHAALHHTEGHATREHLLAAFADSSVTAIHLAVHGDTPPWAPDTAYLLLADSHNGDQAEQTAGAVTASDLPPLLHHDLIFLNSCWSGKPGTSLPDECQSLPTALITAGAHCVIAPLWPVADDAAAHLAHAFYTAWLTHHHPIPIALGIAASTTQRYAHDQVTLGRFDEEQLQDWITTAHAYTCSGAAKPEPPMSTP